MAENRHIRGWYDSVVDKAKLVPRYYIEVLLLYWSSFLRPSRSAIRYEMGHSLFQGLQLLYLGHVVIVIGDVVGIPKLH